MGFWWWEFNGMWLTRGMDKDSSKSCVTYLCHTRIHIYIYMPCTDMYTPFYTYTSHWTIAFAVSKHVSNCISLRTNSSAPIPQDSQYFHAQRHVLLVRPDPRSHPQPVLHPVHIDRSTTVASYRFHLICQPSRCTLLPLLSAF